MKLGDRWTYTEPEYSAASFRNMEKIFRTRPVRRSGPITALTYAGGMEDLRYSFEGVDYGLEDYHERNWTTGLIVIRGRQVLYETYRQGSDRGSRFLSFSLAKPIVSTLVGIALGEGLIGSLEHSVTEYLSELQGTGYDGVPIRAMLQMSSGIAFYERYTDPSSDFFKIMNAARDREGSLKAISKESRRESDPDNVFRYCSNDPQALAWLVAEVSGTTLAEFMAERLWGPLGVESDGYWTLDQEGVEVASIGFNATLRDFARFGLLMAFGGMLDGRRVLPHGWVEEATVPGAPHVECGRLHPSSRLGFQYQWWCIPGEDHAFSSEALFGQFMMVNPRLGLVMVKTGNWPQIWVRESERETYALFEGVEKFVRRDLSR